MQAHKFLNVLDMSMTASFFIKYHKGSFESEATNILTLAHDY